MAVSHVTNQSGKDFIILALDNIVQYTTAGYVNQDKTRHKLIDLVDLLSPYVDCFKVGLELFTALGPLAVQLVQNHGSQNVFLDLKFHDIPNTVGQATRAAVGLGATYIDVHVLNGAKAMADVVANKGSAKVLGITILTSHDNLYSQHHFGRPLSEKVLKLAFEAAKADLDGIVCAPGDLLMLRDFPVLDKLMKVTPGIRMAGGDADDQVRIAAPGVAVRNGATKIVVGRAITGAPDPVAAAIAVAQDIENVLTTQTA